MFYFDSLRENRTLSPATWEVYNQLYRPYQEHYTYHRYTSKFARYVHDSYLKIIENDGNYVIPDFENWTPDEDSPSGHLENAPDMATRNVVEEMSSPFSEVISSKYL